MTDRVVGIGLVAVLVQLMVYSFTGAGALPSGEGVWVFFRDKPDGAGGHIDWVEGGNGWANEELDLPLNPHYIAQVEQLGLSLRVCSRWFNAVSVHASLAQQSRLLDLSFVRQIRPVQRFQRLPAPPGAVDESAASKILAQEEDPDPSFAQRSEIRVVELHNLGYKGQGVRIALFDTGFHYKDHKTFEHLRDSGLIVAERDFVNGDDVVVNEADQPVTGDETVSSQNIHGAQVLSLLAAYHPGRLVGVAPEAEYILAKTEDTRRELPIEEDRWIAGLEWADSLGADIVSSSVGYDTWDDGSGYTYEDLDGATALTSIAAEMAVRRGIIVVEAAGNEGNNPEWPYIMMPADAPGVIAVGAVDHRHHRQEIAGFSSRGPTSDGRIKPDVVAPGVAVVVADIRGGDYQRISGTSFAAPLVSGVCALLLQINPTWGPEQMLESLKNTAKDLGVAGADTVYGWGLVDALRASGLEVPTFSLVGNPFPNPATMEVVHFPLQLVEQDQGLVVALRIFDLAGGLVHEAKMQFVGGANQRLSWEIPEPIANGLYFYQLTASAFKRSGKIAIMR
jgi:serine protease AprX